MRNLAESFQSWMTLIRFSFSGLALVAASLHPASTRDSATLPLSTRLPNHCATIMTKWPAASPLAMTWLAHTASKPVPCSWLMAAWKITTNPCARLSLNLRVALSHRRIPPRRLSRQPRSFKALVEMLTICARRLPTLLPMARLAFRTSRTLPRWRLAMLACRLSISPKSYFVPSASLKISALALRETLSALT